MDAMKYFDPAEHALRMRTSGFWQDRTLDALFAEAVAKNPQKQALVCYRHGQPPHRVTFAELSDLVARAAAALRGLGIGRGDVVSVQLPNWWEFAVVALATGRVGGVVNPLVPILRERELSYMLAFCEAKVFVVPSVLRGFDHEAMAKVLQKNLPTLAHVIVAGSAAEDGFERMLLSAGARAEPVECPASADDLSMLMFTSGTTGEPKGVMHNANTLNASVTAIRSRLGLSANDITLCISPMGHMNGYVSALLQGLCEGRTVVLQDVWDARPGVQIMADEGITHVSAAATFLSDTCEVVEAGGPRPSLRTFMCGGAPIAPVQIERATRVLAVPVSSLWGMTECGGGTLTEPSRARQKSSSTDGRALEGVEVRVVNGQGNALPVGQTGTLMVRGSTMFMGYYKRPDLHLFDHEGWFDTGDLACMDDKGYIRIVGRTKDVVIRGGENIPVVEIENLLYKHAAVVMVAIVGFPDSRLGERCCAFVTLRHGASLTLEDVKQYLDSCKVAKQYWPERLEIVTKMPLTAIGKIQKAQLRQQAKAFGDSSNRVELRRGESPHRSSSGR